MSTSLRIKGVQVFPVLLAVLVAVMAVRTLADARLKGIACRSVHLGYDAPEAAWFYNEIAVEKSHPGTYFMVCGFDKGYFGIQELSSGRKIALFSVWDDADQQDPSKVAEESRVRTLYRDPAVRVGRFGNEGTGGQSFYGFDWQPGRVYRFLVHVEPSGEGRAAFTGYLFEDDANAWKKLVTFDTPSRRTALHGLYSFVEDFKRDRVSATLTRRAAFGNGWVKKPGGEWKELTRARFTADGNPVLNVDAGVGSDGRFFLATGGDITNGTVRLWQSMTRPEKGPPPELPP